MKTKVNSAKLNLEYAVKTKTEKVEMANIQRSVPEKERFITCQVWWGCDLEYENDRTS